MNALKHLLVALFIVLVACSAAFAGPPDEQAGQTDQADRAGKVVEFSIAPYAWLTGMRGTAGARGRTTRVDASFADIREHLDFAGMLAAEIMFYEKFGLTGTINKAVLSDQQSHQGISLSGETSLLMADLEGFYRVASIPMGQGGNTLLKFDVMAGARYWDVGLELTLDTRFFGSHSVSRDRSWVDPMVGARAGLHINDTWRFVVQGDVGGGGNTSSAWDASAFVGYTFWRNATALAGYRTVTVNRREGSGTDRFRFDMTLSGPLVGLMFTF